MEARCRQSHRRLCGPRALLHPEKLRSCRNRVRPAIAESFGIAHRDGLIGSAVVWSGEVHVACVGDDSHASPGVDLVVVTHCHGTGDGARSGRCQKIDQLNPRARRELDHPAIEGHPDRAAPAHLLLHAAATVNTPCVRSQLERGHSGQTQHDGAERALTERGTAPCRIFAEIQLECVVRARRLLMPPGLRQRLPRAI